MSVLRPPSRRNIDSRTRRRSGFILFFGTRTNVSNEPSPNVHTHCPRCGQEADFLAKSTRTWFTLFFIPIFPVSARSYFTQCSRCSAQFPFSAEELRSRVSAAGQQQNQRAISLYNSLRNSPANSITLNELMTVYATMQEFDQAISAASAFPDALNSSEQCMTTLGRVYLAQNRHDEALQWFNAATVRNAMLGEAQYYKALTHMLKSPPEFAQAIAAARAARNAGYPQAEALLREAEEKARGTDVAAG
jgi:tetratricopeptide (TPR) repeat protein